MKQCSLSVSRLVRYIQELRGKFMNNNSQDVPCVESLASCSLFYIIVYTYEKEGRETERNRGKLAREGKRECKTT